VLKKVSKLSSRIFFVAPDEITHFKLEALDPSSITVKDVKLKIEEMFRIPTKEAVSGQEGEEKEGKASSSRPWKRQQLLFLGRFLLSDDSLLLKDIPFLQNYSLLKLLRK